MRIVCISDTHNQQQSLRLPEGDMLIHAGDISVRGELKELAAFFRWFTQQPFTHKIVVAGNHDYLFERQPQLARSLIPANVHYLQDSLVTLAGFNIWGSPWTSMSPRWAFHANPGLDIARHWRSIPESVDILVTHSPPAGTPLAQLLCGKDVGSVSLQDRVLLLQPKVHIFGHIHEGYGVDRWLIPAVASAANPQPSRIQLVNAAILDHHYRMVNQPIVIDV